MLPREAVHPRTAALFDVPCLNYTRAHALLADLGKPVFKPNNFTHKFIMSLTPKQRAAFKANNPFELPKDVHLTVLKEFSQNQQLRAAFKRLVAIWLRKRKMAPANEDDLATCEPPRVPITLWDWPARRTYSFEARTILKDITERLLMRDELWTNPQAPRNPFTNAPLSLGQLMHVHQQLRQHALTHWTLESLAAVKYAIHTFEVQYDTPLRHSALEAVFRNPTTSEFHDILMDFIQQEHDHHGQDCPRAVYLWALKYAPDSDRMLKWRKACRTFHGYTITVADQKELQYKQDHVIDPMTEPLCEYPRELSVARSLWQRQQPAAPQPPQPPQQPPAQPAETEFLHALQGILQGSGLTVFVQV